MARLFQLESICSYSVQIKDILPSPVSDHHQWFIGGRVVLRYPSSPLLPIFCTSSNTQPESRARTRRNARSTMRDTQLCKELQLFLSSQGLPLDKVPSTKELSKRGRDDLAKVVRRRGYKAVQELLVNSDSKPAAAKEDNEIYSARGNDTSSAVTNSISSNEEQSHKKPGTPDDTGQGLESNLGITASTTQENAKSEAASGATTKLNGSLVENQGEEELRRKAAEFVRTGHLDQLTDSDEGEEEDDNEIFEDSSDEEEIINMQNGQWNTEGIAAEKAALLRAKLVPFLKGMAPGQLSKQVTESMLGSSQGLKSSAEADFKLQEIKSALISKERELREVARDLEETKAQLALIQAKATAEVAQAKQLVLEKDIRLKSADLALANLKRVHVEYWGEGERVELAGSFNGWKYFILMESDPTSEISKPDGSRGPMMWGTELWLYPGVYEIKFIIDGVWQIDQRREIMTRNSHHNNILRVEP
ncbi:hypothetical protein GOP47_0004194 [Adiantum capillus-veneris]|uniref:AMP-activated protein kinase glycogen-binding domain-containing protein n=1 Tax=Adiantum capillus-veneris TaxID=13818 RepID=A0A9D4ZPI1_ADICA|nr:hypothetical protein GOP47_0004194 [Adiantum capillus-veneris]